MAAALFHKTHIIFTLIEKVARSEGHVLRMGTALSSLCFVTSIHSDTRNPLIITGNVDLPKYRNIGKKTSEHRGVFSMVC